MNTSVHVNRTLLLIIFQKLEEKNQAFCDGINLQYKYPPRHGLYATQGQFLNGVWIQRFFSSGCLLQAKESILPYYFPIAGGGGEEMDSCLFQRHLHKVKRKQFSWRCKFWSPIKFLTTITVSLSSPPVGPISEPILVMCLAFCDQCDDRLTNKKWFDEVSENIFDQNIIYIYIYLTGPFP